MGVGGRCDHISLHTCMKLSKKELKLRIIIIINSQEVEAQRPGDKSGRHSETRGKDRREREQRTDGEEKRRDRREKRRGGETTDGRILQGSIYMRYFKSVKLIETEKRMWLPRTRVGSGARGTREQFNFAR